MQDKHHKEKDEILQEWNRFKNTPYGKLYLIATFPCMVLRTFGFWLFNNCANKWIMAATQSELKKKQMALESKHEKDLIIADIKKANGIIDELRIDIKKTKKKDIMIKLDEIQGILNKHIKKE